MSKVCPECGEQVEDGKGVCVNCDCAIDSEPGVPGDPQLLADGEGRAPTAPQVEDPSEGDTGQAVMAVRSSIVSANVPKDERVDKDGVEDDGEVEAIAHDGVPEVAREVGVPTNDEGPCDSCGSDDAVRSDGEVPANCDDGMVTPKSSSKDEQDAEKGKRSVLKNKKALLIGGGVAAALAIVAVLFSTHIICFHADWVDATCEEARRCAACGKTEGEPLGHAWEKATCSEPKTCSRCGKTKGEPLGHTPGDWELSSFDGVDGTQASVQKCKVCGATVESKDETIQSYFKDGAFMLSAEDFGTRVDDYLTGFSMSAASGDLDGLAATAILKSGEQIGGIMYLDQDEEGIPESNAGDENAFVKIMLVFQDAATEEDVAMVSVAMIQAAEPTVDFDAAKDLAVSCLDTSNLTVSGSDFVGAKDFNGLHYAIAKIDGDWMMTITPGQ